MRILIKVYPQRSHYNATFPLANKLRDENVNVTYAGQKLFASLVKAHGFDFHEESEEFYPAQDFEPVWFKRTNPIFRIGRLLKFRYYSESRWLRYDPFSLLLKDRDYDFVLVDSPYAFFALKLFRHSVKFGIIESMMPQNYCEDCPPLNSCFIPNGNVLSRKYCFFLWKQYLLWRSFLGILGIRPDYNSRLIRREAKRCGIDPSDIDMNRYFHIGIRCVPEFLLAPESLDIPRKLCPNQFPISPIRTGQRKETFSDWGFEKRFQQLLSHRSGKPLIYCSLGTAGWRYKGAFKFLQKIVTAASNSNWNAILSIGDLDRQGLGLIPENVAIFRSVPQLQVLEHCDLMITHGGMNSIKECYEAGVPMIVYPGTTAIDQAGNAARVAYHQLGLVGNMRRETLKGLKRKIDFILSGQLEPKIRYSHQEIQKDISITEIINKVISA